MKKKNNILFLNLAFFYIKKKKIADAHDIKSFKGSIKKKKKAIGKIKNLLFSSVYYYA